MRQGSLHSLATHADTIVSGEAAKPVFVRLANERNSALCMRVFVAQRANFPRARSRRREHLVVPLFANVENASVQPRRSRARTATGDRRYDRNHWRARGRQTGLTTFAAELLASTKTGLFAQRCSALVRSHVLDFYSAKAQHNSPPEQRGVGRSMQFARVALTNVCTNSIVYDAMLGTKNSCYDDHYLRFAISHNRTGSAGRQW